MESHRYSLLGDSKAAPPSPEWLIVWKFICFVMTVFLLLSAYVQINDPDPWLWIPAYTIPAILSICAMINQDIVRKTLWKVTCGLVVILSTLHSIYLFMVLTGILKENFVNPLQHEEGRELAGTMIVIAWLLVLRFTSHESFGSNTRMLAVTTAVVGCLSLTPLIIWAACFHKPLYSSLGHCKDMFPGLLGDNYSD